MRTYKIIFWWKYDEFEEYVVASSIDIAMKKLKYKYPEAKIDRCVDTDAHFDHVGTTNVR